MGAQSELVGSGNLLTSLVGLLSNVLPMPVGRQFGPLPEIRSVPSGLLDENGNVHLFIMNNAGEPNPVDVRITIDGNDCVWDVFEYDLLFTRYRLRLAQGQHHLVAESERGQARLEADINVNGILHI